MPPCSRTGARLPANAGRSARTGPWPARARSAATASAPAPDPRTATLIRIPSCLTEVARQIDRRVGHLDIPVRLLAGERGVDDRLALDAVLICRGIQLVAVRV